MRTLLILGLLCFGLADCEAGSSKNSLDHTVDRVDLAKYMGRWYEIASFPSWFQRGCICSMAEYQLAGDHVEVKNSCRDISPSGRLRVAKGKAWPVPGSRNSQLKVRFFWPFKGDYWIIGLDPEYRWAMVGHPRGKYLWILSRAPRMEDRAYNSLVGKAEALGYEITRLRKTDQSCY